MNLNELGIIQGELRNIKQIDGMVEHVRSGGFFDYQSLLKVNLSSSLIEIAYFPEDGRYYIHNGHHRAVSIYLGGRTYIDDTEYYLKKWHYKDYNTINFDVGYVTPFDPRKEVRVADISRFKKRIMIIRRDLGDDEATMHIYGMWHDYCKRKTIFTIAELAKTLTGVVHAVS